MIFDSEIISFFNEIDLIRLSIICILTFIAGFLDAIVGGGGLITIPALLINFPNVNVPILFGSNKIAALSGTSIAAYHYSKKIKFNFKILFVIGFFSAIASFSGARVIDLINVNALKPLILIILILMAIYTALKKDFGSISTKTLTEKKQLIYGAGIGIVVGFYDGFFGPGTGSFLVMGFVLILGFDFLNASAYAKIINCITNFSALAVFISQGHFILHLALCMAISNILGNSVGTKFAFKKGNGFIRIVFLILVILMILRYGYEILIKD